jgi:hypothetical protein
MLACSKDCRYVDMVVEVIGYQPVHFGLEVNFTQVRIKTPEGFYKWPALNAVEEKLETMVRLYNKQGTQFLKLIKTHTLPVIMRFYSLRIVKHSLDPTNGLTSCDGMNQKTGRQDFVPTTFQILEL